MRRAWKRVVETAVVVLLCTLGCERGVPDHRAQSMGPGLSDLGIPQGPPRSEGQATGPVPIKKVPVLVGGCTLECAEPGAALAGFLQATAEADDPERIARFLDSTALVVDGRPLGAEWAQMWREMRAATRKESIREAVRDLGAWTRGACREQVRAVLASGPRPIRLWSTEAVYDVAMPGGSWRITLRPRGIEWLVTRIERGGEAGVVSSPEANPQR